MAASPKSPAREWWPFHFQPPAFPAETSPQPWCGCYWVFHTKASPSFSLTVTLRPRHLWEAGFGTWKNEGFGWIIMRKALWFWIMLYPTSLCFCCLFNAPGAHEQNKLFKVLFHVPLGCLVGTCKNNSHTSYWCQVRAEIFFLSLVGAWLRGEACMAQGEILGLLQGLIICWKLFRKNGINTSEGRFRRDSHRR